MKAIELRNKYLEFFKRHGHAVIPSAPLVPENDSSVFCIVPNNRGCLNQETPEVRVFRCIIS